MIQYLLLVHNNARTEPTTEEWDAFFQTVLNSGFFKGGSAIGERIAIGNDEELPAADRFGGYMRFDTDNRPELLRILESHPMVIHGGTVELFELPRS